QRQQRERARDVGGEPQERNLRKPVARPPLGTPRLTFTELCKRVRTHIGQEHRYEHCVRVARMAENLARIHGADPDKARTAGMLHDLARLYSNEKLLEECERRGMAISEF